MEVALRIHNLFILKTVLIIYCTLWLATYTLMLSPHAATTKVPVVL